MKSTLLTLAIALMGLVGQAQYCTSGLYGTGCSFEYISNFTLNTINNSTSNCPAGAYNDFTNMSTTLLPNTAYSWSAATNYPCCEHFAIWIDYNNDQDFDDAGELIYSSPTTAVSWSGTYTTPSTAAGTFRLRARLKYAGSSMTNTESCTFFQYGEVEDYTVTILPPSLTAVIEDTIAVPCFGDTTANLEPFYVGGQEPYTYLWSTGSTDSAIYNMGAGSYSVIVEDDTGALDTAFIEVVQPTLISTSVTLDSGITCNYDLAAATVTATGGTPSPNNYIVDTTGMYNPDSSMTGTVLNLGDDQLTGALPIGFSFDFFGNTYNDFHISSNGFISFDASAGSGCCSGQNLPNNFAPNNLIAVVWDDLYPPGNGSISYYTTGTAPNRKLVVNYIDLPFCCNTTATLTAQAILHETTNCIEIHTTYSNNVNPGTQGIENSDGTVAFTYPGRNASAWGSTTEDYVRFCPSLYDNYEWSSGEIGESAVNLVAGWNYVSVTDGNGCVVVDSIDIEPTSDMQSDPIVTHISCYEEVDGSIDAGISGGIGTYTYLWNTNETTSMISNLSQGEYWCMVEDALNCTLATDTIMIIEPGLLQTSVVNVTHVTCPGDSTGSSSLISQGGIPPYTYAWTPGNLTGSTATGLVDNVYNVQVTDSNGCDAFTSVAILALNPQPNVDLGPDVYNTAGGTVTLQSAYNAATYSWSNNSGSQSISVTETGVYWLEVANGAGCTNRDSIYVEIWPTGLGDIDGLSGITLYPNPARSTVNLDVPAELTDYSVSITDAKGAVVYSNRFNEGGLHQIDVSSLASGSYSVSIKTTDAESVNTNLLISK